MADHFYGINRGQNLTPSQITTGTSTGGTDVELRVADGAGLTKKDVDLLVKTILVFFNSRLNVTAPPL